MLIPVADEAALRSSAFYERCVEKLCDDLLLRLPESRPAETATTSAELGEGAGGCRGRERRDEQQPNSHTGP